MAYVVVDQLYDNCALKLWKIATDYSALSQLMTGLVRFDGLPSEAVTEGQRLEIEVSLLGLLPTKPYRIDVIECEPEMMIMRTHEHGHGIDLWDHTTAIMKDGDGARWIDFIEIKAGWLTWPASIWARVIYTTRHRRRRRMLRRQGL